MILNETDLKRIEKLGWRHEDNTHINFTDFVETIRELRKSLLFAVRWWPVGKGDPDFKIACDLLDKTQEKYEQH